MGVKFTTFKKCVYKICVKWMVFEHLDLNYVAVNCVKCDIKHTKPHLLGVTRSQIE